MKIDGVAGIGMARGQELAAKSSQSIDCSSLPGLKRTALPGGIETSAPVRGFRPIPVLRGRTLNTPKPRNSMRSPVESAFFMLSKTVSTASSALVLVIPVRLTTSLMMSSLITGLSRLPRIGLSQVIDAKGDSADCQPGDQSRNMAAPAERDFVIWRRADSYFRSFSPSLNMYLIAGL